MGSAYPKGVPVGTQRCRPSIYSSRCSSCSSTASSWRPVALVKVRTTQLRRGRPGKRNRRSSPLREQSPRCLSLGDPATASPSRASASAGWRARPRRRVGAVAGANGASEIDRASPSASRSPSCRCSTCARRAGSEVFGDSAPEYAHPAGRSPAPPLLRRLPPHHRGHERPRRARLAPVRHRAFGGPRAGPQRGQLRMLMMASAGGVLNEAEAEIAGHVLGFADKSVGDVMVPRVNLVCLDAQRPLEEAVALARGKPYSRYPLMEGDHDEILGVVHVKELFGLATGEPGDLRSVCREAMMVPENKPLDQMLRDFQRVRTHMAIVLDEYGGTAGIVTLEDVLEVIVGDISRTSTTRRRAPSRTLATAFGSSRGRYGWSGSTKPWERRWKARTTTRSAAICSSGSATRRKRATRCAKVGWNSRWRSQTVAGRRACSSASDPLPQRCDGALSRRRGLPPRGLLRGCVLKATSKRPDYEKVAWTGREERPCARCRGSSPKWSPADDRSGILLRIRRFVHQLEVVTCRHRERTNVCP